MKAAVRELSNKHLVEKTGGEDGGASAPTPSEESDANNNAEQQSTPEPEKFVNTGLQRWEEIRNQWLASAANGSSSTTSSASSSSNVTSSSAATGGIPQPKSKKPKRHARDIDIDEVIDLIVSNRWRQTLPKHLHSSTSSLDTAKNATRRRDEACFPHPVSLPQMVDVLVDLWEAEGLDI